MLIYWGMMNNIKNVHILMGGGDFVWGGIKCRIACLISTSENWNWNGDFQVKAAFLNQNQPTDQHFKTISTYIAYSLKHSSVFSTTFQATSNAQTERRKEEIYTALNKEAAYKFSKDVFLLLVSPNKIHDKLLQCTQRSQFPEGKKINELSSTLPYLWGCWY